MQNEMSTHDEQKIGTLIQRGGPRPQPGAAAREAVRSAVHAEWQAVVAERASRRRRTVTWAMAAGLAVAGVAVWMAAPTMRAAAGPVATIARLSGDVATGTNGAWQPVAAGTAIRSGSELRTSAGGRVALQFGAGLSVRLDENSLVAVVAPDRIELKQGAVYVDAGDHAERSAPLFVETAAGTVRHLGTQYEARLVDRGLQLRVREGRVALAADSRTHEGGAGEQLIITREGAEQRSRIARAGSHWAWVSEVAPVYDIEERTLAEFLRWASRETGREVVYSSPRTEVEAQAVVLRGSIAGLTPERALDAVLSTTQLSFSETTESLLIDFRTGDR